MINNEQIDPEILKRIEENRRKAIEIRQKKLNQTNNQNGNNLKKKQTDDEIFVENEKRSKYFCPNQLTKSTTATTTTVANNNSNYTQLNDRKNFEPQPPTVNQEKKVVKILIKLIDKSRFLLDFKYEEEIVKKLKYYETRHYDPQKKQWSFSLKEYSHLMNDILKDEELLKNIKIEMEKNLTESLINLLLEYQEKHKQQINLQELKNFNEKFYNQLYPYQRDGIVFGIQNDGKLLIADDMGLGKTIQAIGLARYYRDDWPLIIICPSSLRFQWKNKCLEYFDDLITDKDIFVATTTKELFPRVPITITSYDLIVRMNDRLTSIETNRFYRMIIMDESHYIKSDDSKRTDIVGQIARSCKRVVLLSGTPALSRPIELFPQINLISPELFPSKHAFGVRYCQAQQKTIYQRGRPRAIWNYKGADNLDELRIILEQTIMIRRLKKDVLDQLPSKKREMISIPMDHVTDEQRTQMNLFIAMMKKSKKFKDRSSIIFKWFQTSSEIKIPSVLTYLKELLTSTENKLICFCHHAIMMDSIEEMLRNQRISFIRIDGSTQPKLRQDACDMFQNKKNFRVALLSLTACATGLNLTAAKLVIFTELYWTPGVLAQAEDRSHRIGQVSDVRVLYLVAKGTIDEMLWPLLSKKLEILNKAGLSRDTYSGTFNPLETKDDQSVLTDFFSQIDQQKMN